MRTASGLFLALLFLAAPVLAGTELLVYTAAEPDVLPVYGKEFSRLYPDITIKWIRDSTGPVLARLAAEKDAPRADAIFALSLSAVLTLPRDMLETYRPSEFDALIPAMRDNADAPSWIPFSAWGAALCVNERECERLGLPVPKSWADLTDPVYAGHIVMPSPVSSGTGLFLINSWLDLWGADKGWEYMEKLDANIKMYIHSGSKPAQMAAQGEAVIGLSSASFAQALLRRRAPLSIILPEEGVGWDMEVSAIVRKDRPADDPVLDAARKLMDFTVSADVAALVAKNGYVPPRADSMTPDLAAQQAKFLEQDFAVHVARREAILAEWRRRFEKQ